MNKTDMKWFLSKIKIAIKKYNLISTDDHIAVALSGGKDSMALLYTLSDLQKHSHLQFTLSAFHIDMGWPQAYYKPLQDFCKQLQIPFFIEQTNISQMLMPQGTLIDNPCSLCSRIRRGALLRLAETHNISKIALGHHRDDFVETLLLNIFHGGKYQVFAPNTYYPDKEIHIIRPLVYVDEATTTAICKKFQIPVLHNPCPAEKHTQREEIKTLLSSIKALYPDVNQKFIHSLETASKHDLWNME